MTTENILQSVNSAEKHLETIKAKLFEVQQFPLVPQNMPSVFKVTDKVGNYKSNGGECLGVVGSQFVPMQPSEFLDNIIETVHEFGADLDLNTLQFKEFLNGSRIEFSIQMYPLSFKNNKGLNDITNLELTFSTAYNGTKSNTISLYTERLVCTNGMVASKLQGALKGRNTISGKAKILSYGKEVAEIVNGATEFKEKMIALDKIKVTKKQIEDYKLKLLGYNRQSLQKVHEIKLKADENAKLETRKINILELLENSIDIEFKRTGQTAFGLLQGVTHYTNHVANTSKTTSNDEYIRFALGFQTNEKAQELAFAML